MNDSHWLGGVIGFVLGAALALAVAGPTLRAALREQQRLRRRLSEIMPPARALADGVERYFIDRNPPSLAARLLALRLALYPEPSADLLGRDASSLSTRNTSLADAPESGHSPGDGERGDGG